MKNKTKKTRRDDQIHKKKQEEMIKYHNEKQDRKKTRRDDQIS